jgi:hypothetical protein
VRKSRELCEALHELRARLDAEPPLGEETCAEKLHKLFGLVYSDENLKRTSGDPDWDETKHPRGQPGNAGQFKKADTSETQTKNIGEPQKRRPPLPLDTNKLIKEIQKPEYKKLVKDFISSKPVCSVTSGSFTGKNVTEKRNNAKKWVADNFSKPIKREDIGEVIFNERGVDHSLHHDDNTFQSKLDAMKAVPDVIKNGKLIHIADDYEGKPIKNLFLIAPIAVDNLNKVMFVRIRRNAGDPNRFYVHEVLDIPQEKITPSSNPKPTGPELYQKLLGDILH